MIERLPVVFGGGEGAGEVLVQLIFTMKCNRVGGVCMEGGH